jgi:hypothetical protein
MRERDYGIILSTLIACTVVLMIAAATTENGTVAWVALIAAGGTIAFMIGADPR